MGGKCSETHWQASPQFSERRSLIVQHVASGALVGGNNGVGDFPERRSAHLSRRADDMPLKVLRESDACHTRTV
jgi:hypothetical protein